MKIEVKVHDDAYEFEFDELLDKLTKFTEGASRVIPGSHDLHSEIEPLVELAHEVCENAQGGLEEIGYALREFERADKTAEVMELLVDYRAGRRPWSDVEQWMSNFQHDCGMQNVYFVA